MKRKRFSMGVIVLAVVAIALGYAGWKFLTPAACQVCLRPLHAATKTVGTVAGKKELFCCPTCALTAHRQTGKVVDIKKLSNYETGSVLTPEDAYIVEGSSLNLCIQQHVHMGHDKQASQAGFDRCSPSIFTFADKGAAERFQRVHGGNVMRFRALAALYQH